jgi:WD40 repeat protein/beta-lactamase regulating signal transducer with metallopeptidase domain
MSAWFPSLSWSEMSLSAIAIGARVTLILALVLVAGWLLNRRRALIGSAILHAGLVAALFVPLICLSAPRMPVPCLPASAQLPSMPQSGVSFDAPQPLIPLAEINSTPTELQKSPAEFSRPQLPASASVDEEIEAAELPSRVDLRVNPALIFGLLYAIALLIGLVRLAMSLIAVKRLVSAGVSVDDSAWLERLAFWRQRLGVQQLVAIVRSSAVHVPLTVGWRHPVIVLPRDWEATADLNQRDAVLVHELAHVLRGDYAWQLVLRSVQVIYWFHPLAWLLAPLNNALREQACDDLCVYWMQDASTYRRALVQIAIDLRVSWENVPGPAIMRSSRLRRRLAHIDQSSGSTAALARPLVRSVLLLTGIVVASLVGSVELISQAATSADTLQPAPQPAASLDHLQRSQIDPYELRMAGGGDAAKAPAELVAVLGNSRFKHLSYVKEAVYSPDGTQIASAGGDGMVRLWDAATGNEIRAFPGRPMWENGPDTLSSVAFSPDGRTIAAGSDAHCVFHWEVATGKEIRLLRAEDFVYRVGFSPDGRFLATAHEAEAAIWELDTGKLLHKLGGQSPEFHRKYVTDHVTSAFSHDGNALYASYPDGHIRTWEVSSGRQLAAVAAHTSAIRSLALSMDGKLLATGGEDKTARIWESATLGPLKTFKIEDFSVDGIAFHPDGQALATGCLKIFLWDLRTGKEKLQIAANRGAGVSSLSFSPDGKTLVSTGGAVRLWSTTTGQPLFNFAGHTGGTTALAFAPDGATLVSGGGDNSVLLWDVAQQRIRKKLDTDSYMVRSLAVTPDARMVATQDARAVRLWNLVTGEQTSKIDMTGDRGHGLAVSPDGRWLAIASSERGAGSALAFFDIAKGRIHGQIRVSGGGFAFTPDGKKLYSVGDRGIGQGSKCGFALWDVEALRREDERQNPGGLNQIRTAALSPDGRTLALAGTHFDSSDQSHQVVLLWDVAKQQPRLILDHEHEAVQYMDFASDGRSLVTLGFRATNARIWDPRDGTLRATIKLCEPGAYRVQAVRFAPDSRHFAAALANGTIYLLRAPAAPEKVAEATRMPAPAEEVENPSELWKTLQGKPAPELERIRGWLFGKPVKLADLRGRPVVLHFWDIRSNTEIPTLMFLRDRFAENDLGIIVVYGLFGDGPIEGTDKWFAHEKRSLWGGRDPNVPFALDGGGELPVLDTQLNTHGATHAAYRILSGYHGWRMYATTLLIDAEGNVAQALDLEIPGDTSKEIERLTGKHPRPMATLLPQFGLQPGQSLRRIPPPLPKARDDLLIAKYGRIPNLGAALFQFDGDLAPRTVLTQGPVPLRDVLRNFIGLKRYEFQGSDELLTQAIAGDWVVRKGAAKADLMSELSTILKPLLKQPVRFTQREMEQDVIVARGKFQPPAGGDLETTKTLHFSVEPRPIGNGWPGTFKSVRELMTDLSDLVGLAVVTEVPEPGKLDFAWQNHLAPHLADIQSGNAASKEKLQAVLNNLAKETSLELKLELRKAMVWEVERGAP